MDQSPLVERQIEDGRRLIEALDAASIEVVAALWFYFDEPEEWRLLIASPAVDRIGSFKMYFRLGKIMDDQFRSGLSFDLAQIVVVGLDHPIVRALKCVVVTPPGGFGSRISNFTIDQIRFNAYLYRNLARSA